MTTHALIKAARRRYTRYEWATMAGAIAAMRPEAWDDERDEIIEDMANQLGFLSDFYVRMHNYHVDFKASANVPEWATDWMLEVQEAVSLPAPGAQMADIWYAKLIEHNHSPQQVFESMDGRGTPSYEYMSDADRVALQADFMGYYRDGYAYYLEDLYDHACAATEHQMEAMRDD